VGLAFSAADPAKVVATVREYDSSVDEWYHAAVVSNDSGVTWQRSTAGLNRVTGWLSRIELAPAPSNSSLVYASLSDGRIWRSLDGGLTYVAVTVSGNSGASWYNNALWVDPTNPNRLVIGGTYIHRSTDGGATLTKISNGYIQTVQPHPDVHYFIASPGYDGVSNRTLFTCTDGGVYKATDIATASTSAGWERLDLTARTTQFYSVAGNGATGRIVGGLQDNGTLVLSDGGTNAKMTFGGDGGSVAIDPTNPDYVYGEYIDLRIFRNRDGGRTTNTNYITTGLTDAGENANFIAPFVMDPNQPQVLLGGGASLWRCANARATTPTWSAIRSPGSDHISAIAIARGNSDIIWVAQNDGVIAKTTNGTAASPTWTPVSGTGTSSPIPKRYVTRILIDPDNANVVYVTLGGFTSNNVWKTVNAGATWVSITGTNASVLPQVPVRAIAREPGSPQTLYVGTEVGIFVTADGGQTWTTSSDLSANVSVDELAYMSDSSTLLAATHGRGIWVRKQKGSDVKPRLVWRNDNGAISHWKINAPGQFEHRDFGPYAGWSAKLMSVGADNRSRIAWQDPTGKISLWTLRPR
jgi:hypothetical protein